MDMTKDTTVHQARTIVTGLNEQHLIIEERIVTALTVYNVHRGEEISCTIYLSKEQWAELAVAAQKMADESPETKDPKNHLTNEQVLEGQRVARLLHVKRVARDLYTALFQGTLSLQYLSAPYGQRAVDLLIELGLAERAPGDSARLRLLNRDSRAGNKAIDAVK